MVVLRAGDNATEKISAGQSYNWEAPGASYLTYTVSVGVIEISPSDGARRERQEASRRAMLMDADEDRRLANEWDVATPPLTE